jgi:glycosyltransferase involved in cell wall biosynthesis
VFLQTQVGVDESLFVPSESLRKQARSELGFEGHFVVGYAGRITSDKGVDDIASVFIDLSNEYNEIALLLIGNGDLRNDLETKFRQEGLAERVCITGFVDQSEVSKYMNAMDAFVLGSKTTKHWIDTFPLVTVQAQAVGVPVIASNSGSIPWQLGESAIIYPEGDRDGLKNSLLELLHNPSKREFYALKGRERSLNYFCHIGMTKSFKKIVEQIIEDEFIYHRKNEPYTQWKAY